MNEQEQLVRTALEKLVEYWNSFTHPEDADVKADDYYHTDPEFDGPYRTPTVVVDQQHDNYHLDRFLVFYIHDWDSGGPTTVFAKFDRYEVADGWILKVVSFEFDTMWSHAWDDYMGFANKDVKAS